MIASVRRLPAVLAWCLGLSLISCDGNGTDPHNTDVWRVDFVAGADQVGLPGTFLAAPLVVEVRSAEGERVPGVVVRFEVSAGSGARLESSESLTDAEGRGQTRIRLGLTSSSSVVRAFVDGASAPAEATVYGVAVPALTTVPAEVEAGGMAVLEGNDLWSPVGGWVSFSGIRARVTVADEARLQVEVPSCLPDQTLQVRVGGPTGTSQAMLVRVRQPAAPQRLSVGESQRLAAPEPGQCLRLGLEPGDEVLLLMSSAAGTVGGSVSYAISAVGQRQVQALPGPGKPTLHPGSDRGTFRDLVAGVSLLDPPAGRPLGGDPDRPVAQALTVSASVLRAVPTVGDVREFQVLQADGRFATVPAEVRHVSERGAFFVETSLSAPVQGDAALMELGELFDQSIWEVNEALYGLPSDLDGNGRVAVLMTSGVNRFEGQGGEGRVGGFFFPVDLMPGQPQSNGGEILYVIAPDSAGMFGEPISVDEVVAGLPGVLVHELQHLVHFNQRVLSGRAPQPDATWLSEALATMAEDRLAMALAAAGSLALSERVANGNTARGVEFLNSPSDVSLIIKLGTGTLAERGAGWLFLRYLTDRFGESILGELTRGPATGIKNVERVTGSTWSQLLAEWGIALWADGLPGLDPTFQFETLDLRTELGAAPALVQRIEAEFETVGGTLYPSSVAHLLLQGERLGDVALGLQDGSGAGLNPSAGVSLTAVRVR